MDSDLSAWLYNQFYCRLIGTVLPAHWFGPRPPAPLSKPAGKLQLEIVSHCWQYAHLAVYQLSSLVNYPTDDLDITYTLYYSEDDEPTVRLTEKFAQIEVPNIKWQFQPMPKNELCRRAIGRNKAALSTRADWIWFTDCDLIFHKGCLDSLASVLSPASQLPDITRLVFPATEQVTELLPADHPMVNLPTDTPELVDVDPTMFRSKKIEKATGPLQIVHGDVARHCGYCKDLSFYQRPTKRWRKTFEDTAFRRLIADEGQPVDIVGVHRIRHQVKGRYAKDSAVSNVRQKLRKLEESSSDRSTS